MKNNAPVIEQEPAVLKFSEKLADVEANSEIDLDMLEIEEAKKLFEDYPDLESFWAGRLLADRKSTRIAA